MQNEKCKLQNEKLKLEFCRLHPASVIFDNPKSKIENPKWWVGVRR